MDTRQQALEKWLRSECKLPTFEITSLVRDASFRRYFRIQQGEQSFVAMDAPPKQESNTQQFIAISAALRAKGLQAPEVQVANIKQGFLLLTDFGNDLYIKTLNRDNAEELYSRALRALAVLQTCRTVKGWRVPAFNVDFMYREMQFFKEWFLQKHLQLHLPPRVDKMLRHFFQFLAEAAASQPQVFMHRDYHSANLMVLPERQVGILDFQDAFIGPVTYDLVSLLRDCYIAWPESVVTKLALQYKAAIPDVVDAGDDEFLRWFDLMGLHRHLKALLTFSRKYQRDKDANYLQHIPRTLLYIMTIAPRYAECRLFNDFLNDSILPLVQGTPVVCAQ